MDFGLTVKNFFNKLCAHALNVKFIARQPAHPDFSTEFVRGCGSQEPLWPSFQQVGTGKRLAFNIKHRAFLADAVLRAAARFVRWAYHYRFHCYNIPHKRPQRKRFLKKVIHHPRVFSRIE
jgi:hypothetical protein